MRDCGRLRRTPFAAGEEGRDVAHNKAESVEDCPGYDDSFEPSSGLIYRLARLGEVHHQQGDGRCDNGGNCGNQQDLVVDVLHDLFGFLPHGCRRKSLLGKASQHTHRQERHV